MADTNSLAAPDARANGVFFGGLLVAASLLSVFSMSNHPGGGHGGAMGAGWWVHGAMIILLALMYSGFVVFSLREGLRRSFILLGLVANTISLIGHVNAATINGFIVPALAKRLGANPPHELFMLLWEANQAFARLGVFATSAAYFFWSLHLLHRPGWSNKLVGLTGLAAAGFPAAALALDWLKMDLHGALLVYTVHAAFAVLVGVQMLRRKL